VEDWIANTFNGAEPMQIGIALVVMLGMCWVLWIGARSGSGGPPSEPT
jgi:hypothetical protein